jgi:hypothetical protein
MMAEIESTWAMGASIQIGIVAKVRYQGPGELNKVYETVEKAVEVFRSLATRMKSKP